MCIHGHTGLCRASLIIWHVSRNTFFWSLCHVYCIACIVSSATLKWLCIILFITKELLLEFSLLEVSNMFMYFFALYIHTGIHWLIIKMSSLLSKLFECCDYWHVRVISFPCSWNLYFNLVCDIIFRCLFCIAWWWLLNKYTHVAVNYM